MFRRNENLGKHGRHAADNYGDLWNLPGRAPVPRTASAGRGAGAADSEYRKYSRSGMGSGGGKYRAKKSDKRKTIKIVLIVVAVIVVLLALWGAFLFNSVKTLRAEASTAMQEVSTIQDNITGGEYQQASQSAQNLAQTASSMKQEMDSPLWGLATLVPFVGSDVSGVKTVVKVLDEASHDVLVPLTDSLQGAPGEGLVTESGAIDVATVSAILGAVQTTAPAMNSCAQQLSNVPEMNLSQLKSTIDPAKEKVVKLNEAYQQAAAFAPVIGAVLGQGETRTYLIVAQNSAEIRAAGGFPGSVSAMTLKNGKISLGDFGTARESFASSWPKSVAPTDTELDMFGSTYLQYTWNACVNPDFERTAKVWAQGYKQKKDKSVDGVISVTPAMVQDMLAITGAITLADGTKLDGTNATKVLQHDLYWKYMSTDEKAEQNSKVIDALFAEAASKAFKNLLSNMKAATLSDFAQAMMKGMQNRTVMFYLTDADEQAQIASLNISGGLSASEDREKQPTLGTFINIGIPSKLGWYVDIDTQVSEGKKNADGTTTYSVTTTYKNTITKNEADKASTYIIGTKAWTDAYGRGDMQPFLYLYAPSGGSINNLSANNISLGDEVTFTEGEYNGTQVFYIKPVGKSGREARLSENPLKPEQSIVCTYEVTVSDKAEAGLNVTKTPTLTQYR